MNSLISILFPMISLFAAMCLVLIVSYDYKSVQSEILKHLAESHERAKYHMKRELQQARYLRNALVGFHLAAVSFILSVSVAQNKMLRQVAHAVVEPTLWLVGFGCIIYGIINLLNRMEHGRT